MLLRTDPSRHRIVYLSIPRDLRVPIAGVGDTKINAAMQAGGRAARDQDGRVATRACRSTT